MSILRLEKYRTDILSGKIPTRPEPKAAIAIPTMMNKLEKALENGLETGLGAKRYEVKHLKEKMVRAEKALKKAESVKKDPIIKKINDITKKLEELNFVNVKVENSKQGYSYYREIEVYGSSIRLSLTATYSNKDINIPTHGVMHISLTTGKVVAELSRRKDSPKDGYGRSYPINVRMIRCSYGKQLRVVNNIIKALVN